MNTINKDVLISIRGTQNYSGHEQQELELVTDGKLLRKGGSWLITYPESEMTGMEGTQTTFEVSEDGVVTLHRRGTVAAEMRFQEGKKCESLYSFGREAMLVGIQARHVTSELNESGGHVEVDYAIEIEHNWAGYSRYALNIRPLDGHSAPEQ